LALTESDQDLIDRCVRRVPGAWEEFVDRFAGLVLRVVRHTVQLHGGAVMEDRLPTFVAAAFATLLRDDFAVLRRFRGRSSLASYLAVTARRTTLLALSTPQTTAAPAPALSASTERLTAGR
jgi:RNA polymerase sigma-70 factor (ECF subfamily)